MKDKPIPDRVQAGVELLDRWRPSWERSINLDDLDITDCEQCVLGQLYGDYEVGRQDLDMDATEAADRGFVGIEMDEDEALNVMWRERIEARLAGEVVS